MAPSVGKALRHELVEYVEPVQKNVIKDKNNLDYESEEEGDEKKQSSPNPSVPANKRIKPNIKKGEKVYALWLGGRGDKNWYPGRIWDIKVLPGKTIYGPVKTYDIVYDDGDTETNLDEIFVMKKEEYEIFMLKKEKDWIGVTNFTDTKSQDAYARIIGWYDTWFGGEHRVYSSLGEALRAYDKHIIDVRGRDNILDSELNFPEEHIVQSEDSACYT